MNSNDESLDLSNKISNVFESSNNENSNSEENSDSEYELCKDNSSSGKADYKVLKFTVISKKDKEGENIIDIKNTRIHLKRDKELSRVSSQNFEDVIMELEKEGLSDSFEEELHQKLRDKLTARTMRSENYSDILSVYKNYKILGEKKEEETYTIINDVINKVYNFFLYKQEKKLDLEDLEQKFYARLDKEHDYVSMLKFICSRISHCIRNFKDAILSVKQIKFCREKFFELKKTISNLLSMTSEKDAKKLEIIIREKTHNEILNFCFSYKLEIISIIKDLTETYESLIKSSYVLDHFFKIPISLVSRDLREEVKIKSIHNEEFLNVIINDEFIKALINEVKNGKEIIEFIGYKENVIKIENAINETPRILKKLYNFFIDGYCGNSINQKNNNNNNNERSDDDSLFSKNLSKLIKSNLQQENLKKNLTQSSSTSEADIIKHKSRKEINDVLNTDIDAETLNNLILSTSKYPNLKRNLLNKKDDSCLNSKCVCKCQSSEFSKLSIEKLENQVSLNGSIGSQPKPKKPKKSTKIVKNNPQYTDIDDLYQYIVADDAPKTKKKCQKKAISNKKIKNEPITIETSSSDNKEIDYEIEEFKRLIENETVHADSIKKIKPNITHDWLENITLQIYN